MNARAGMFLAAAALAALGPAPATAAPSLESRLDAALHAGRQSTAAPAATGAVIRCGKLLWSGADGVLDLESKRPATPNTLFASASTGKPTTAALVMDLIERGKLSLNTRLSRFYPGLPRASKITIRMLLNHTAGLNEYFDDPHVADLIVNHPDHDWKRREVLKGITKTLFEPGTDHEYSNSAYVVLGGVIEKVTGQRIPRVFRSRLATPLGMAHSIYEYRPKLSRLFAHPYTGTKGDLHDMFAPGIGVPADFWGPVWTDGGIALTASDLARFGNGLFEGTLLKPESVRQMSRQGMYGYGFGITTMDFRNRLWRGHDGRYVGYELELWYDRSHGITVTVATNAERSSLAIWKRIVAAYDQSGAVGERC
jgi:D-alanyl-D-alanine carboxypeptidase